MRRPRTFRLFALLCAAITTHAPLAAGQANRTVDDFSPLITYSPADALTHTDITGFNISKLYNGTVGIMNTTVVNQINMTLKFTGASLGHRLDIYN
jgi:hypothetical protein